jgi:hypothetical protein
MAEYLMAVRQQPFKSHGTGVKHLHLQFPVLMNIAVYKWARAIGIGWGN